ncbi:helix-turn-helix transcriptional regulator [Sphingomonas astaxanthinifaciens]|nr:AraC family transcriptional regulator [Sphingomonas astaxanthinifaciens]
MPRTAADSADPHSLAPVELIAGEVRVGAFSPHRHETYTIAATTSGVQSFNYRGDRRRSLPGQLLVLHPDELHDGYCSDSAGFSYRAIYLPPAQVQSVIGGVPLPFLANGVSSDPDLVGSALRLMAACAATPDAFAYQDALHGLVSALQRCAGAAPARRTANRAAVTKVREYLDTVPGPGTSLDQLEALAGTDRWSLTRDFRALLGTSPYRYLVYRRLGRAKALLRQGQSLAAAAHDAGFSDQSHFCRVFKAAFGLTPRAWHRAERRRTIIL